MSRFARWRQLPPGERRLALGLALLMPLIDLSLRMMGFQRSWAWLARFAPQPVVGEVDESTLANAQVLAALARVVGARSPWRTTCLRQALAVWLILRRRRVPVELKIGVTRREPPFQAHAWVEVNGVALDPDAGAHTAFPAVAPPG